MNQIKGEDKRHKGQSLLSFEITDLLISAYKKLTYNCDEDVISSVDEFVLVLIIDTQKNQMIKYLILENISPISTGKMTCRWNWCFRCSTAAVS